MSAGIAEIDAMLKQDAGRDFRPLDDSATLRSAARAEKGAAAMELVDLPPLEPDTAYFTNASGMTVVLPKDERDRRLAEAEAAGAPRVRAARAAAARAAGRALCRPGAGHAAGAPGRRARGAVGARARCRRQRQRRRERRFDRHE